MITLGITYYDNFKMFERVRDWYADLRSPAYRIMWVDDASPEHPLTPEDINAGDSLIRINEDVGWNNEGAKNLIMHLTPTKWTLLADLDHVLMPYSIARIKKIEELEYNQAPFLRRIMNVESGGKVTFNTDPLRQMAANSYAITKQYFWELGGYNESLQGLYGYDGSMVKRLGKHNAARLDIGLHCYTYGGGGSSWTRAEKDESQDKYRQIGKTIEDTGERLRFTWQVLQ